MSKGMAADTARFAAPNPPLASLQTQIAKVEDADKLAHTRAVGAAKVRNLERDRLFGMLETECGYVKTLCDASPEEAIVIIQAAGLASAAARAYTKPLLKVARGFGSGSVVLTAAVGQLLGSRTRAGRIFHWQSTTNGGQTFNDAPPTTTGKTSVAGLTPLTTVGFRVKVTTATSSGEWTPIVSILVQ